MGGHAYWYWVPYRKDVQSALDDLRAREHEAGRYNPVIRFLKFSEPAFSKQNPGKEHDTIEEAIDASAEDGTRSILDIASIGDESDYGVAGPLSDDNLLELFGTTKPTRAQIEDDRSALSELVDRGKAIFIVTYDAKGIASELFFYGYSYD